MIYPVTFSNFAFTLNLYRYVECGADGERGDRPQDAALAAELGGRLWPSPMDLSLFPFDKQRCEIVMASWFYPGSDVNLTVMAPGNPFPSSTAVDPRDGVKSKSTEFIVHPVKVERIERFYTCCPGGAVRAERS